MDFSPPAAYVWMCMYTDVSVVYWCVRIRMHVYECVYAQACVRMFVHIRTYAYGYKHTHTWTLTNVCVKMLYIQMYLMR